jgi:class 3 adenylate cyclase/predicted ATPase
MECPNCHSETPDKSKFCISCGAALPARCPSCGSANPAGAKFCLECGQKLAGTPTTPATSPAVSPAPRTEGSAERRQLTVMFCDLVGSTALSARLDPEDMREIIGAYHRCCAEQITKAGGFVAKYMGDGVLAYFGYPQAHEDDAERAVRSALALTEAVPKLRAGHDAALQVRVGLATGLVVVGDLIGEGDAQERGVVGETPNLAARLQALAEPGQLVISNSTRRLTGGMFEYHDLGKVTLKGLGDPVQAWVVTGSSRIEGRFEAHHETKLTPLVGREEELELLLRRWQRAKTGEGQVVLLSGEPGIGKSRLTVALQERLQHQPHSRVRYFCSPHHTDNALYPTITQLERAADFERRDTSETKLDKLVSLLDQPSGHGSDIQLLTELLSIPTGDRYAPLNVSPQRKKEKTFEALLRQLEMLARQRPVLVVYEDVHWIDPSSRELLDMTVERVANLPVLLIITFRPEVAPPWTSQAHVTNVGLNRLSRRDGAALVGSVAGSEALPDEIMEEIVERTDGVPLFVEELTKAVLEAGVDDKDRRGTVSTVPRRPLAVPATLHASLMARLDRLGPVAKEIAQIGAGIGREFSYELLAHVAQKSGANLRAALGSLSKAGLVSCRGTPPQAAFLFKHALVRDAAYGTLLRGQRRELHARISAMLEDRFPEIVIADPALVARHCAEAGLAEKAVLYWRRAGEQAMARSAMKEAVAHLRKGLGVLSTLPDGLSRRQQELDLHIALRPALAATKGYSAPDVGETIARARALAEQADRSEYVVSLLYGQWAFHLIRSEHKLALLVAEQLEKVGEARNDVAAQLQGRVANAVTRLLLGEFVAARALLEQCQGLRDPAHRAVGAGLSLDPYAAMLQYLAVTLAYLGYIDQARKRLNEGLSEAHRVSHFQTLAEVLIAASWIGSITRSPRKAQRDAEKVLAISTEHGFSLYLGLATAYRGASLTALGQAQEGLLLLTQALAAMRATGSVFATPLVLILLAEADAVLGQPVEGLNCLSEAAQIIETTEERYHEAELHRLRGDLLNATGDPSAAERNYHQALAVARRQSAKLFELRASTSLARLWRDQGKRTEARDLLAPIYGWFTEGFDTPDLKEAKALLDELR